MQQFINNRFKDLQFEPVQHKYTLDKSDIISVSKTIEKFYEQFPEGAAQRYADKNGLSVEVVQAAWDTNNKLACDFGHYVHDFGERYYSNRNLQPRNYHEVALVKFWNELPYTHTAVACEARVYTRNYWYSGTFDLLIYDSARNGYIIADYKTNKDLFKNFKEKKMLPPFENLLDNPFNHYQVQLSLYQIPLEEIGIKILERWIIWLQPNGEYTKFLANNYTDYLKQCLN